MTDQENNAKRLPLRIGYCTNVHAGRDLPAVLDNLLHFSLPIRQLVSPESSMGVGLWFSEVSAQQAIVPANLHLLRSRLDEYQLVPFTLNGFPQGDFHSQIVKHRVYQPTWWQRERCDYTLSLIRILDALLPAGEVGSISTLPIAWSVPPPTDDELARATAHLMEIAMELHQLFERTGRKIVLAIEPEPGCFLTDSASFRAFFNRYLSAPNLTSHQSHVAREYLTLCHDICHAAVMFEDQVHELNQLERDGIGIGKVQVSAAIRIDWQSKSLEERVVAWKQLSSFAEDRYLHQTTIRRDAAQGITLSEDLGVALSTVQSVEDLVGQWRVHFHVPIFLTSFGLLESTQPEIKKLIDILAGTSSKRPSFTGHYEVETYAWSVLPDAISETSLSQGIAKEIGWFKNSLQKASSSLPRNG
jgi:hypothetical protein